MKPAKSANEVLANVYEDHGWTPVSMDPNSTGGIQRILKAHEQAIQELANFIDKTPPGTVFTELPDQRVTQ